VIDGSPLAVPAGPFAWATVAPTPTFTHGDTGHVWWCELHYARAHEGGSITHRRKVVLVRGHGIVVCDWIDGDAPPALAIHWPLADAPDDSALSENALTSARYAVAWTATHAQGSLVASLRPIDRSTGYARRQDARLLRLEHGGPLPACIVSCFSATPGRFHVQLDDRGVVRVGLDAEDAPDEMSALVLSPGVAPAIDKSQTRVPSHGAVR
jgi:hypothetical protein